MKVSAKLKDGKTLEILFGSENPKKTYNYAKLANSNDIFLTGSNWSKTFTKTTSDVRNKKLLEFESDDIDGVKIAENAKELEAQKSAAQETRRYQGRQQRSVFVYQLHSIRPRAVVSGTGG